MSLLRVNTNVAASNAAHYLSLGSAAITTSLKRMSAGLRITTAADDPAGLSIAERLRAQYRGLTRASMNAQDGISLLQTASGSLDQISTLLQDIRELAVSAADGTKTASDRAAIQEEVSQYVDEINRLARGTEFGSKSLLDGSLGALVTTSDYRRLSASLTGDVGQGGSYLIQPRVKSAGVLQRLLSDVFTVTGIGDLASPVTALKTYRPGASIVTADGGGVGRTGAYRVELPQNALGSVALARFMSYGNNATLSLTAVTAAAIDAAGVSFAEVFQAEELSANDVVRFTFQKVSIVTLSLAVGAGIDINTWAGTTLNNAMSLAGLGTAVGTATGQISLGLGGGVLLTGVTFIDKDNSGSNLLLSFNGTSGNVQSNVFHSAVSLTFRNNYTTWNGSVTKAGANDSVLSIGNASTGTLNLRFSPLANLGGAVGKTDYLRFSKFDGGNNLQNYGHTSVVGAALASGSYLISATGKRTYALFGFNNSRYTSLVNSGVAQSTALLAARGSRFFVDAAPASNVFSIGQQLIGETLDDSSNSNPLTGLRLKFDGGIFQAGEQAVFELSTTNAVRAGATTTLASIDSFRSHGVFSSGTSQSLDLYTTGHTAKSTIVLNATDTLEDLTQKLSLALWTPPLDGGSDYSGLYGESTILAPTAPPQLVRFNPLGTARGTLSIAAPQPGDELVITGNDNVVAALGLDVQTAAMAPVYSVAAVDLTRGIRAGSVVTATNRVDGLIPGMTLYLDQSTNLTLDPEPPVGNTATNEKWPYAAPAASPLLSITPQQTAQDIFLHVTPAPLVFHIGARSSDSFSASLPDMSAVALGLDGLNVATAEWASAAIGAIDSAIGRTNLVQARAGAYQNSLESTMSYLDVAAENAQAAESRIRDLDYAREIISFTRAQAQVSAAAFALAQANVLPQQALKLLGM